MRTSFIRVDSILYEPTERNIRSSAFAIENRNPSTTTLTTTNGSLNNKRYSLASSRRFYSYHLSAKQAVSYYQTTSKSRNEDATRKEVMKELQDDFLNLFGSGSYSDLIIKCGDSEYKVHKAIVCSRSPFFQGACKLPFKVTILHTMNELRAMC